MVPNLNGFIIRDLCYANFFNANFFACKDTKKQTHVFFYCCTKIIGYRTYHINKKEAEASLSGNPLGGSVDDEGGAFTKRSD